MATATATAYGYDAEEDINHSRRLNQYGKSGGSAVGVIKNLRIVEPDNTVNNLFQFTSNNIFTQQFGKFLKDYSLFADKDHLDFLTYKQKFSVTLSALLSLHPDAISSEYTSEHSLFFTLKKDEFTFFLQQFLSDLSPEEDEA